ncbi:hypothetical protein Nepgr_011936 [Nepenthes gracilis]|uniref:Interactor of constitutive active ROPs 3 n=1 Tax=Nepenthes gracilis TaxID=150966 RepID=A0AAD3XMU5_NEPGR|nr:hypothetical protein Nepgr_011936 [Nepenthes gracilis]
MQASKTSNVSAEGPQKKSPATPRTAGQLRIPGSDSDPVPFPNPSNRTPNTRSPKFIERGSPRILISEKKRSASLTELDSQLAQLQDEWKKVKDQLSSSETLKGRAQLEAEETKKQLAAMSDKLEESRQQLLELSSSEEARVQELCKISHDRDQAWKSRLEALQEQHAMDSASLACAMNEIQKLKKQLEMVSESEATQSRHTESAHAEIQSLRVLLSETLITVEKIKNQLNDCKQSEAHAIEVASQAQMQLEAANATAETLRLDGLKAMEAYNSLASELEQSKAKVSSLEIIVSELQAVLTHEDGKDKETERFKTEIESLKVEVAQLKSAMDASEIRYHEEYIRSTLQIGAAYDAVDHLKSESSLRDAKVEEELNEAKSTIEELKLSLTSKETMLQALSDKNKELNIKILDNQASIKESELAVELKKLETDLKAAILDKETQLQSVAEENEMLKMEIKEMEMARSNENEQAAALAEAAKAAEREALMKLGYVEEEADRSTQRAARVAEQLDAVQMVNTELEAEMRRLKVQLDQWRKAAEAAAAMLSPANNGKFMDRSGLLDSSYHAIGAKADSPYSDEMDCESPKKKYGNMLKRIGVLWKKGFFQ